MGCGVSPMAVAAANPSPLELTISMNMQLDKWNSRQIILVRSRFKLGLSKQSPSTLDLPGFHQVFPNLSRLPRQVRTNAFQLFDKDSSGDIDFKEFCYVLTTLIHGSFEEQRNFVCHLFDLDHDSAISVDDFKSALLASVMIKRNVEETAVPSQEVTDLAKTAEKTLNGRKSLSFAEFCQELENHIPVNSVLELFEIIPSPANEYKIIKEILMKAKRDKTQQVCHIINFKWWNMWHTFVKKYQETSLRCSTTNDDFWFFGEDILYSHTRQATRLKYIEFHNAKTETEEVVFHKDEAERPGEIDNADLEGPIKGTLKDGLRYMHDYVPIPNEAWKYLWGWYGGGPVFERVLIVTPEGKHKVELYPPVVYAMLSGEDGIPLEPYVPCIISKTYKLSKAIEIIKAKFGMERAECRLWYRFMVSNSNWELVTSMEKTVEEIGLSYGDKLVLEQRTLSGWPRDKITKNEPQWEVGDKVDVYLDSIKTWKEGKILENKPKHFQIQIEKDETIFVAKNSSIVAPYRTHTTHNIVSILTPDMRQKLVKEFKPLANLGNT